MADLKQRLRDIESLHQPDLWADIERRQHLADRQVPSGRPSRIPVFVISLASIAVVALIVATLIPLGGGKAPGTSDGRYHAPAGWSIVLPPGWHALPFSTSNGGASAVGVQLSNVTLPPPTMVPGTPIQTNATLLPADGVSLIIAIDRDPSGVQNPPKTPPTPPLVDFHWLPAIGGINPVGPQMVEGWFRWDGQTYIASAKVGSQATSKDRAALDAIIASLRFGEPGPAPSVSGDQSSSPSVSRPFFKAGIQNGLTAPSGFVVTNEWQGLVGRNHLPRIWAGAPQGQPEEGELLIRNLRPNSDGSAWRVYSGTTSPGPSPDGSLKILSVDNPWLRLQATDGVHLSFNTKKLDFSQPPTCAPKQLPWASSSCTESVWARQVIAAAGGTISGLTQSVEPQPNSAFVVQMDGYHFSFGALSKADSDRMSQYFSMGEFPAGMPSSGSVGGVFLAGSVRSRHWVWTASGFTVEIYQSNAPRSTIAKLVTASVGVPPP